MSLPWNVRRYESYARAMEEAGLSPRQSSVESDSDEDIGYLAAKAILASDEAVSAIFAGSDSVVEGVYQALRDCNLSVPQHISVAGFDDVGATSLYPPLTTVHVFTEQL